MPNAPAFDARAYSRKNILARHGMTEADLGPKKTGAQQQADALVALPKSVAEAKGDARAFAKADMKRQVAARSGITATTPGRANMEALVRQMGMEPAR